MMLYSGMSSVCFPRRGVENTEDLQRVNHLVDHYIIEQLGKHSGQIEIIPVCAKDFAKRCVIFQEGK